MKAAAYLRVSTADKQDEGSQLGSIRRLCDQRGFELTEDLIFRERESGAKGREEREELKRLLEAAHRGEMGVIVVWRVDRLSRDGSLLGGTMMLGELLEQYKVPVVSVSEPYMDMTGPFANSIRQLTLDMAQAERQKTVENTIRVLKEKQQEILEKGRTLVTGKRSKRTGQWISRLGRPSIPRVTEESIERMAIEGTRVSEIARTIGVSRPTVYRVLREKGITREE